MGLAGADQGGKHVKSPSLEAVSRKYGFDSLPEGMRQTRYISDRAHRGDIDARMLPPPSPNQLLNVISLVHGTTMVSDKYGDDAVIVTSICRR